MSKHTVKSGESRGEKLSRFAERHGITRQRAHQLKKNGLPVFDDGTVDPEAADRWVAENVDRSRRAGTKAATGSARDRKEAADAALKELELSKRRGELVERLEADRAVYERARRERDAWLSWAAQVAPKLAAELGTDEGTTFRALDEHVRAHLETLSQTPIDAFSEGSDDGGA